MRRIEGQGGRRERWSDSAHTLQAKREKANWTERASGRETRPKCAHYLRALKGVGHRGRAKQKHSQQEEGVLS